ncbi:MAG: hypothetical protein WDZ51_06135 [Pirellulaceae bacterium]
MTVISSKPLKQSRSFEVDENNNRTYNVTYQVITDSTSDGALLVANAPGISIGTPYNTGTEADPLAVCIGISSECVVDDGKQWHVSFEFGKMENEENPLNEPAEVEWSFAAQHKRLTDTDYQGNAIVNTAKDPFAEAIEIDDSRPILRVTRNEANFPLDLAYQYKDAINATPFFGAQPHSVKVVSISSRRIFDQTYGYYWQTSYEFAFDPSGWDKLILNQGMKEIVTINDKKIKRHIRLQGEKITEPELLNEEGQYLYHSNMDEASVFLEFRVYQPLPFDVFNF